MKNIQSKKSLPYWFETEEYKQFSKLAHNNFGGKPSMETLEEAAKTFATRFTSRSTPNWESFKLGFIEGAKWQQERMCNHTYILISEQGHRIIKCQKCDNTQPI